MNFNALVTSDVRMKGIGSMEEAADVGQRFDVVSASDLFAREWDSDAHFVVYRLHGTEGEELEGAEQFRLRKTVRTQIEEAGGAIRCWGFVGDYDLNENVPTEHLMRMGWDGQSKKRPKVSWTADLLDQFTDKLESVVEALRARDLAPGYIYLTNHGARFVHFYSADVAPMEHEEITAGMIGLYHQLGMVLDDACVDWTRMFRAPRVVRGDTPTGKQPWFREWHYRNAWTIPALAPKIGRLADDYVHVKEYVGDRPTPSECLDLLTDDPATGRKSEAFKEMKKLFKRRGLDLLMDILVGKTVDLPEGSRDKNLISLAGQLAIHTYEFDWASPELVYAVLLPIVENLQPDAQTQDWFETCWSMCRRMWTREMAKAKAEEKERVEIEERNLSSLDALLENVRTLYPKNALLRGDYHAALFELSRMGLVKCGPNIYVMRPDGYYHEHPTTLSVLGGTIEDMGMDFLMPSRVGGVMVDGKDLLKEHGREVSSVIGTFGLPGGYLDGPRLVCPLFRWAPHVAQRSEWVDMWLRFLGGKKAHDLMRWLAYAQDMRRPICALALVGRKGVGKGMLARGLQELIEGAPVPGGGEDLVSAYTPALMRSPFIVVDEGLPVAKGFRDVADTFRRMVAGEPHWVNQKFKAQVEVCIPYRILMSGNNPNIVHGLVGNRTLTVDDREALAQRIRYIEVSGEAATWLCQQGGRNFTSGWVAGDGVGSNYVVARHLRWLYENREELFGPPENDRFLISGDAESSIVEEMRVCNGMTPEVARVCVYLIHHNHHTEDVGNCMSIDEETGEVFITTNAVTSFYANNSLMDKKLRLNDRSASAALDNLTVDSVREERTTVANTLRRARWRKLDLGFLLRHAEEHGLPSSRIAALIEISR